jgi:dethiobiotin synthetase
MFYPTLSDFKASQQTGFFVTGTDTDVGKTFVSVQLIRLLIQDGLFVSPRKPIASGCIRINPNTLFNPDASALYDACQSEPIKTIGRYALEPALSPQTALAMCNQTVLVDDLVDACNTPNSHFQLVEGAGGFLSPICTDGLNRDLAKKLALNVILVAGNRLGCLNQILLSVESIKNANLKIEAVIINNNENNSKNYAEDLHKLIDEPIYWQDYQH